MTQKDRRDVIKTLYDSGITSPVEICRIIDIPRMTVFRTLKLIRENKSLEYSGISARGTTILKVSKEILTPVVTLIL